MMQATTIRDSVAECSVELPVLELLLCDTLPSDHLRARRLAAAGISWRALNQTIERYAITGRVEPRLRNLVHGLVPGITDGRNGA
jgi:hypothetical protein